MARRWWVGGTPRRRWVYRRRLASRRDVRGRPVTLEGTRGYDRAPTNAVRPIARDHPSPRPKKTSGKTGERGPICQGPGAVWCAFSPVHVRRSVQDVADGLVFLLLVERRRSVGRHCSPARSPASAGAALQSKKEPATFRATQISLSPTGPSRAYLSRCERFRRPSSCAPVGEGD